jgi:hypothetical protein
MTSDKTPHPNRPKVPKHFPFHYWTKSIIEFLLGFSVVAALLMLPEPSRAKWACLPLLLAVLLLPILRFYLRFIFNHYRYFLQQVSTYRQNTLSAGIEETSAEYESNSTFNLLTYLCCVGLALELLDYKAGFDYSQLPLMLVIFGLFYAHSHYLNKKHKLNDEELLMYALALRNEPPLTKAQIMAKRNKPSEVNANIARYKAAQRRKAQQKKSSWW